MSFIKRLGRQAPSIHNERFWEEAEPGLGGKGWGGAMTTELGADLGNAPCTRGGCSAGQANNLLPPSRLAKHDV